MTREQITQIEIMRQEGNPYSRIATALSLSVNTVKSYCARHNILPCPKQKPVANTDTFCKACGKKLPVVSGKKPLKFCSSECRIQWWNTHPEAVNRKAIYSFVCADCGKTFTSYGNAHRKYCSHACYIRNRFGGGCEQ